MHFILSLCALAVAAFLLFYQLGEQALLTADESLYANAALEMLDRGDWITVHFMGEPSHYNVKPPLAVWLMAGSVKAFGTEEWAFRLPSALAVLATIALLLRFVNQNFKNAWWAGVVGLVLATSPGYMHNHIARTADTDALFILFVTLLALSVYRFLHGEQARARSLNLGLAALALWLAFMTKGLAAFLPLSGLLLYALWVRKAKELVLDLKVWLYLGLSLIACASYLFLREGRDPGFFAAWYEGQFGGRYFETFGGHDQPLYYYALNLLTTRYFPWIIVLVGMGVAVLRKGNETQRRVILLCLFTTGAMMLWYTLAATKLPWYDGAFYPFAALVIGIGFAVLWESKLRWISLGICLLSFGWSGWSVWQHVSRPHYYRVDHESALLKVFGEAHPEVKELSVYKYTDDNRLLGALDVYARVGAAEGLEIELITSGNMVQNRVVLASEHRVIQWLEESFETHPIFVSPYGVALSVAEVRSE